MTIVNERGPTIEENGGLPVNLQDQSTQAIILPFVRVTGATTLAAIGVIDTYTITVTDPTGIVAGKHLRIIDAPTDRFYAGEVVSILGSVVTLDTQLDYAYANDSEVTFADKDMTVDGSVTPVIFTARTGTLSIPSNVDITRIIFTCITDSPVELPLFGDIPKLLRGLAMRLVRGDRQDNIFNVKTNEEITNIAYDYSTFSATNPAQGVDGFSSRLTFAGQNKIGVVLRIAQDENVEMLVQDDLTDITRLIVTFEGHVVSDS